jgi:hypothetical protein
LLSRPFFVSAARPAVAPYHFDSALDVERWTFDVFARA